MDTIFGLIKWIGVPNILALVAGTISLFVYLFYITYMNVPIGYVMTVEDYVLIVIQAFGDAVNTLVCVLGVIIFNMKTPKKNTQKKNTPQENTPQENTPTKNIPQENTPTKNIPQEDTSQEDTLKKNIPKDRVVIEINY